MEFTEIRAYKLINFINEKCKFMVNKVDWVVFRCAIMYEEAMIPYSSNFVNIRYNDYHIYDYPVSIETISLEKPKKGVYSPDFPYHLIRVNHNDVVSKEIKEIKTIGDFISIFYPAPTGITFKVKIGSKSSLLSSWGPDVFDKEIISVDILKTCIRINAKG